MKKRRFKVGDKVTYKDRDKLPNGEYHAGGVQSAGVVGEIVKYNHYWDEVECYVISVTNPPQNTTYHMLESEFEEFDSFENSPDFQHMLLLL